MCKTHNGQPVNKQQVSATVQVRAGLPGWTPREMEVFLGGSLCLSSSQAFPTLFWGGCRITPQGRQSTKVIRAILALERLGLTGLCMVWRDQSTGPRLDAPGTEKASCEPNDGKKHSLPAKKRLAGSNRQKGKRALELGVRRWEKKQPKNTVS